MGRSRKARTWGGLPDYTEHRNKLGEVTSRTTYHKGKATTTHGKNSYPEYKRRMARIGNATESAFTLGEGGKTAIAWLVILVAVIAGFKWIFDGFFTAMEGSWTVIGTVLAWTALALWLGTVVHLVFTTLRRSEDELGFLFWLATIGQGLLVILGGLVAWAMVTTPAASNGGAESILDGFSILSSFVLIAGGIISSIVFAFVYSKRWLFMALGAVVLFIVLAISGTNPLFPVAIALYAATMTRLSIPND